MRSFALNHIKLSALLAVVAAVVSCNDRGVPTGTALTPPTDCGIFELFRPADTVGDYYYITGVRVFPLDKLSHDGITDFFFCRTLRGQIAFSIQTEYRRLRQNELSAFPGIRSDPIVGDIVNPIKWTNASLRVDRDIGYRGQIIPAGANILDRVPIKVPSFYFPLVISPFAIAEIHMSTTDFSLSNGEYHLVTSWETFDNKTISDTVDVMVLTHQ
jgi:hypothetical protein